MLSVRYLFTYKKPCRMNEDTRNKSAEKQAGTNISSLS